MSSIQLTFFINVRIEALKINLFLSLGFPHIVFNYVGTNIFDNVCLIDRLILISRFLEDNLITISKEIIYLSCETDSLVWTAMKDAASCDKLGVDASGH